LYNQRYEEGAQKILISLVPYYTSQWLNKNVERRSHRRRRVYVRAYVGFKAVIEQYYSKHEKNFKIKMV
jgi:hypothetical protein